MDKYEAEELTEGLRQTTAGGWRIVASCIRQGVPEALGLTAFEWVTGLGPAVRLRIDERREAVAELAAEGMSQRQIGAALGVDAATVNRDLNPSSPPVANATPAASDLGPPAGPVANPTPGVSLWGNGAGEPPPDDKSPWVAHNTGEEGWYTPGPIIAAAVEVMGRIDLDPASTELANNGNREEPGVGAEVFYTREEDGLTKPWAGKVWLNPPYRHPAVAMFGTRLAREWDAGNVVEAMALVNNTTEVAWFQEVAARASALCFLKGRLRFWQDTGPGAPMQGQAIIYLGPSPEAFRDAFVRFGFVTFPNLPEVDCD
jgi:ParB family chromosome partitioning protein